MSLRLLTRGQFLAVAIALAFGVVLHSGWLPTPVLVAFLIAIAARAALAWRGMLRVPWWLRIGFALALVALVIQTFGNPFGREGGSALLLALVVGKTLELTSRRDARVVLTVTCFVALAAFLFDQGPVQMALSFALVLLIVAIFHDLDRPPGRIAPTSILSARAARQALRYALSAVPFAIVAFVLFPRLDSPLWGAPADAFTGRTGISDSLEPGALSSLALDDTPVMRVRFDGAIPEARDRYFRGLVFWWFDGARWAGKDALSGFNQPPVLLPNDPGVAYEVIIEPTDQRWLFALDAPSASVDGATLTGDFQLRREQPLSQVTRYRVTSHFGYRMQPELDRLQRRLGLQTPGGFNPRATELAERWAASNPGDARAISAQVLALFNADFIYTLEPPLLARDSVDDFLFSTRAGFCEHFASAYAFMMRAAGIPARVVIGFQGGIVNRAGGYLVLRRSDAHAWNEIWIAGEGWVRVDPTAAVDPSRVTEDARAAFSDNADDTAAASWLAQLRERSDLFNYWWNRSLIEFSALRQRQLLTEFGAPSHPSIQIALLAAFGALTLALASWLIGRRRRRRADPALAAWLLFKRKLARAGLAIDPSVAPEHVAALARAAWPEAAVTIDEIRHRFIAVTYARATIPGTQREPELAALTRAVREFRPRRLSAPAMPREAVVT